MALPIFFEKSNYEIVELCRLCLNSKGQGAVGGISRWLREATG
jgi:hypothetical protein